MTTETQPIPERRPRPERQRPEPIQLNYLTIPLPEKKKVKAYGGQEVEIDKIEIFEIRDINVKKEVFALCRNHPTRILLWDGEAYDAVGQWTNDDVVTRVLEIAATFENAQII